MGEPRSGRRLHHPPPKVEGPAPTNALKESRHSPSLKDNYTSKPNIIAILKAFHAHGIRAVTYGKAAAGGVVGYENARRDGAGGLTRLRAVRPVHEGRD